MAAKLLDQAAATGASNDWQVRAGASEHTIQSTCTGSPTAVTTEFEGSLDGTTWYQLAEHKWTSNEITAQASMFHVSSKLITHTRINLSTLTGGTSPTVTCLYEWND